MIKFGYNDIFLKPKRSMIFKSIPYLIGKDSVDIKSTPVI